VSGEGVHSGPGASWLSMTSTGGEGPALSVQDQVDKLIKQATSVENLCQLFMGWCPFW
jgi:hypothetical protein